MREINGKRYGYIALDSHVLLVAVETPGIDWTAYIGAVPGISHEQEFMNVAEQGTKADERLAKVYFQNKLPWRD